MRILIYRLGSLGDTIVALPCFRLIRKTYPHAHITVLTNAPVSGKAAPLESVLQNSGLVDNTLHYPIGLRDPRKLLQLRATLCRGQYDLAISLTAARGLAASIRDYFFFKSCGIPKVIGVPFSRRDQACQPRTDGNGFESESERLLHRIQSIGTVDLHDPLWYNLGLTSDEISKAKQLLDQEGVHGKFVVASLGTKLYQNDWGTENWKQLFADVSHVFPGLTLVLLGSSDEFDRTETLLSAWNGPRANFCGKTSTRMSAALLREALLFVGHDSGPMHLASAVGTRCVVIYSTHAPPGQWFPFGDGHINLYPYSFFQTAHPNHPDYQREAIASIRVEDVFSAVRSCLS